MSVVASSGERVELDHPPTADDVWDHAFNVWARSGDPPEPNRGRLRNLAILMLYQQDWTQPNIAAVFGLTQGRISQLLGEITSSLRVSYVKRAHVRRRLVFRQRLLFEAEDD